MKCYCIESILQNKASNSLTFPKASRTLSKKNIIPMKRNKDPNPVSPIPISKTKKIKSAYVSKIHSFEMNK